MNNLVFLEPNRMDAEPFTTSDIIAEHTRHSYRSIQRTIENQMERLEQFGQVRFEITPVKYSRGTNMKKVYHLNEPQATLLITFLKNNDVVADFKVELVRQFYAMRGELLKRQTYRLELRPIRRELTDVIQAVDGGKWAYKKYTDLAYQSGIGRNAAQLRKARNAPKKAKAVDYMTAEEIAAIAKRQSQIAVLLEMGLDYQQVKAMVLGQKMIGVSSRPAGRQDAG